MERVTVTVDTARLMEFYRTMLPQTETLPLCVTGSSMSPFLADRRDTVYLSQVDRPLKVGDIVLYQRDSGEYILHRICRAAGECYTLIGDAHSVREPGVRRDQIFGLVRWVERKGVRQGPGDFWWEFFRTVWVRVIPLRRSLCRLYALARKFV